jgi:hypothetical protein
LKNDSLDKTFEERFYLSIWQTRVLQFLSAKASVLGVDSANNLGSGRKGEKISSGTSDLEVIEKYLDPWHGR